MKMNDDIEEFDAYCTPEGFKAAVGRDSYGNLVVKYSFGPKRKNRLQLD